MSNEKRITKKEALKLAKDLSFDFSYTCVIDSDGYYYVCTGHPCLRTNEKIIKEYTDKLKGKSK